MDFTCGEGVSAANRASVETPSPPTHQIGSRATLNSMHSVTKNADCICNLRMQSAFVNQLALNQAK
ncbi:hypothetical protein gvb03_05840 [Gardnerella vaginalis]|nr:hypothetical protein gvb02_05865 [Gardnerella vaginalis]RDW95748.1 hypothetical protein gvb03_05840 [Gardnerella vaginalis]